MIIKYISSLAYRATLGVCIFLVCMGLDTEAKNMMWRCSSIKQLTLIMWPSTYPSRQAHYPSERL